MVMSVILAAGKGTRMVSDLPKVLHSLVGAPLLEYAVEKVEALGCDPRVVVIGYRKEAVEAALPDRGLVWAHQDEQLGTGHAAATGVEKLPDEGEVLVLNGDLPVLRIETLRELVETHQREGAALTVLTCEKSDPHGYGRIIRSGVRGAVVDIVEEKDADEETRKIPEINVGVTIFSLPVFRECYARIGRDNAQDEYYLTDVVVEAARAGHKICTVTTREEWEIEQVNSRREMASVAKLVRRQILDDLMDNGVTIDDPDSTFVEKGVKIGKDSRILPFTHISRGVEIEAGCEVGPFTRLRPGTVLRRGASIGNFVEIKGTDFGSGSKARHLAYIGDTTVGERVNFGAGTVVANYDGRKKHRTQVDDGAFIGCGTVLVAPVRVGRNAMTGAGAIVTRGRDVADGEVVVGVPAKPLKKRDTKQKSVQKHSAGN